MVIHKTTLLQITDLHLRQRAGEPLLGVDTDASLRGVLQQAMALHQPDALLVTGDIVHDPHPAAYQRALDIIAEFYTGPLLLLPGNHDIANQMTPNAYGHNQLDLGAWRIVVLDSHVDDTPGASIDPQHWQQVQQRLQAAGEQPVLLATHHPMVAIDCPWLDKDRIQNSAELLDWAAANSAVQAVAFGHAHQEVAVDYQAQTPTGERTIGLRGAPSTCFQFAPNSASFAVTRQAPGYRLWALYEDGGWSSQVHRLANFEQQVVMPATIKS